MRPTTSILAALCVAAAVSCTKTYPMPEPPAAPPPMPVPAPIIAPMPPAPPDTTYTLLECESEVGATNKTSPMPGGGGRFDLPDGAGDVLTVFPGGAPGGTGLTIQRLGPSKNRMVHVSDTPTGSVTSAAVTLSIEGCTIPAGKTPTVVRQEPTGWRNVKGTLGTGPMGRIITSGPLPGLSIYAVATN